MAELLGPLSRICEGVFERGAGPHGARQVGRGGVPVPAPNPGVIAPLQAASAQAAGGGSEAVWVLAVPLSRDIEHPGLEPLAHQTVDAAGQFERMLARHGLGRRCDDVDQAVREVVLRLPPPVRKKGDGNHSGPTAGVAS